MTQHSFGKAVRKTLTLILLVALIVPLLPPVTWAQEMTSETSSVALPADVPAPSDSGNSLSFQVAPPETSPAISSEEPQASSNLVPENPSLSDRAIQPSDESDEKPSPSVEALSVNPTTPPQNEIFDSQIPLTGEIDKTGAYVYSYPIAVPPGRNNIQPDLKLSYTSNGSDLKSIFGENWAISIPYIQRLNRHGADALYSATFSPVFVSSFDGELATTTVTSVYAARTENGTFRSYTLSSTSNQWVMSDKSGMQYTFGSSTSTRQDDPNNSGNIYKWMLTEIRDTNSNYVSYAYSKDKGAIYPSSIVYTGNGSTDGIFEIDFQTESRSDTATSWETGFAVNTLYRINEIDAKVNGTLAHKYVLGYGSGANAATSLLRSITETGYDESSNPTTLPATMFSYNSNTPGWTSNATWNSPVQFVHQGVDNGYQVRDVTGDGLPDIMRNFQGVGAESYINNGQGWAQDHSWDLPVYTINNSGYSNGYQFVDVNGDHLTDIVLGNYIPGLGQYFETYLNNAHGWNTDDATWHVPVLLSTNGSQDNGYRFVDVNGDGLLDIVIGNTISGGGGTTYEAWIHNGHGWTRDDSWDVPQALTVNGTDHGSRIIDLNGDGLPDIEYNNQAYINNGHGWSIDASWNLPISLLDGNDRNTSYQILDINGDHLPDIIFGESFASQVYETYINNGQGWNSDDSNWHLPTFLRDSGGDRGVKFADFNSDGLFDFARSDDGGSASYTNNGQVIDLLTQISHPAGGQTNIQYKQVDAYVDGSNNLTNTSVPFFLNTVYKVSTSDASVTSTVDTFSYKGGKFQYYSPIDKRFAAFGEIDKTDNAGNVTKTFYHTGSGTDSVHGEYQDNYWKIGKSYRVEKYDAASNLYQKTINKWDVATSTLIAGFVKLAQTETFDYDGQVTHKEKGESYTYDDSNGNQTQKIEYGQVAGSDDGTFSDTGTDKFTTDYTFTTTVPASSNMSLVNHVTVSDQSASKVKEAKYYYDNLGFGSVTKGDQTKEEDWKSSTTYITIQKGYNSYGLTTSSTDPRGKITTYVYDAYNLYPATATQPLSLVSQKTYIYATGKVKGVTDENANKFLNTYDGLGRPTLIQQPDPSATTTLLTKTAYVYNDATSTVSVHQTDYLNSATSVDTYTYYNGLKRIKQTRKSAEGNNYETKDFAYNTIGLLQQESLPYFSVGPANATATTAPALLTTHSYDALQRTLTIANILGTTTRAYLNWKTTITDPNGKQKDLFNDAYGNLIEVDEHNSTATYTTTYTYNGLGALTSLTDALANVRNFTYDGLGRRLTAQDLHASGDATYGSWTYTYDDANNLTQVVDPKSQTINRTYDDINRILTEDYTGQSGTEVTYSYDFCTQGRTRLCSVSSSAVSVSSTKYNALGQLTQESRTISSSSTVFTTANTYDRQGNQLTITNPDNSQINYTYNPGGRVETIQRKEATDSSYQDLVTDLDYSPMGKVSRQVNANCTVTTNTYDPAQIYRLTNKLTVNPCQLGMMMLSSGSGSMQSAEKSFMAFAGKKESGISREALQAKYMAVPTINGKYQLQNTAFRLPAADKNGIAVEVGDRNSKEFIPKLTIGRWDNEASFTISPHIADTAKEDREVLLDGKIVKFAVPDATYNYYEIDPDKENPDGAYEFSVTLAEKPTSSTITFDIQTTNLEFNYQSALNQEPHDENVASCTETECVDANGNVITQRPENMVGGYAVYHSRNRGDLSTVGGYNFRSGKAFDLYRPRITDAAGHWVWGVFTLDEGAGTLSITTPQTFLDNAVYPITIDPTVGYTTVGATQSSGSGIEWAVRNQLLEGAAVTSINIYTHTSGLPVYTKGTIYDTQSASSYPNSLLVTGAPVALTTTAASVWITSTVTSIDVTSATIWLGFVESTSAKVMYYNYDSGANYLRFSKFGDFNPNNPFGSGGTQNNSILSLYVSYTASNSAPLAPTDLLTESQSNPSGIMDVTPEFSAVYRDPNTSDTANYYEIQVSSSSSDWSSLLWDSGRTSMADTSKNNRSPDISYAGVPLALDGSTYYWRIKFWDSYGAEGIFSTSTASFTLYSGASPSEVLQNISYTYDAVGNITKIVDSSPTDASSTITYAYDDLNRLTSATATGTPAGISSYTQTYTYDSLGNITNKSDLGSYTYATASTVGYANPDAAVYIATSSVAYDKNGNVTSVAVTSSSPIKYTWDYLNRLTQSGLGTSTSTYAYDASGQRVRMAVNGSVTSYYPTRLYNYASSRPVKNIFANGELVATVNGTGASTTVGYVHTDHLGGTNAVTDSGGNISELTEYFPYGSTRLDQQTGFNQARKYIGEIYDSASQLSYLNARYYDGSKGKFLSQDPLFQLVGDHGFSKKFNGNWRYSGDSNQALQQYLANPQNLNSYTYALGNPLRFSDPSGESPFWEQVFNGVAGRGFKTDSQVLQQQGQPQNTGLPKTYVNGPGPFIGTPVPAFTLQQGSPVGPSQAARYQVAGGIDKVAGAFDAYSQGQNISGFAPTVASTLVSVPGGSIPVVAVQTVQAVIEASFFVADITSTLLGRVANNIRR